MPFGSAPARVEPVGLAVTAGGAAGCGGAAVIVVVVVGESGSAAAGAGLVSHTDCGTATGVAAGGVSWVGAYKASTPR